VSGLTAAFHKPAARRIGFGAAAIAALNALLFVLLAVAVEDSAWLFGAWAGGLMAYAAFVTHRLAGWLGSDNLEQPRSRLSIFISYRRQDSRDTMGRIYDHLRQAFDERRMFLDVERQAPGEDYRAVIDRAIAQADVLLAVVGPSWLSAARGDSRRLDDPGDMVRLELEAALARNLWIVPVLIEGASMPSAADLPPSLQSLCYRTALAVRPDPDFRTDMPRLIAALQLPRELGSDIPAVEAGAAVKSS
jgi:hypothetical protein